MIRSLVTSRSFVVVALVITLGACGRRVSGATPPRPATSAVAPPTHTNAADVEATPATLERIAGIYPGEQALAVIVAHPARILVQRAAANVVATLTDVRCEPVADPDAPTRCTFRTDACDGTIRATRTAAIGSRSADLVITARPREPVNMIACATLSLDHHFSEGGPVGSSVPGAAVGAPRDLPAIPSAACLVSTFEPSASGAACLVRTSESGFDAYLGSCCLGTRVAGFEVANASLPRALSDDGRVLVSAARPLRVSPVDVRTDAVLVVAQVGTTRRELRVRDLLGDDPATSAGTSFDVVFELEGPTLVVRAIGGAPHRVELGG